MMMDMKRMMGIVSKRNLLAKSKGKPTPPPARTQLIPLHRGHKRLIKIIKAYSEYRQDQGSPILDDWSDVTPEDFNDFRMR